MLMVTVNGLDRRAFTAYRSLRIDKEDAREECVLDTIDMDRGPAAFRIAEGDSIRVTNAGLLEMGGEAYVVTEPITGRGGIRTQVRVKGWTFQAGEIRQVRIAFPSQGLYTTAEQLRVAFLAAKGWTNNGATSGGPILPALVYDGVSVLDILNDLQARSGIPWRVNGDRQFQFAPAGTLLAPVAFTEDNSVIVPGASVTRSKVRRATRLFVSTGGAGAVWHHEDHIADGFKSSFPVHVLPVKQVASLAGAAGSAATTLSLRGLRANATVAAGDTFVPAGQATTYTIAADATTDDSGAVTVSFTPGLAAGLAEGESVTFDAGTFVRLEVNGVPTPLNTGAWSFHHDESRFIRAAGAAPVGTVVRYLAPIELPALVRVWDASALTIFGAWNYTNIRDAELSAPEQTDLAMAKPWADAQLASRATTPAEIRLRTFAQGCYPWQRATVDLPTHGVAGDYLIKRVTVTDVGKADQVPQVEVTLLEGDALGTDWTAHFRERAGVGAASAGGAAVLPGGAGTPGGGGGTSSLPTGTTLPLGGDNAVAVLATTTWQDIPQAIPLRQGGPGMAGSWLLRAPVYQLAAGTLEVRLLDQTTGATLSTVSTTAVGSYVDNSFFAFPSAIYAAPTGVDDVLAQYRVTSGSREVVIGKATAVKL